MPSLGQVEVYFSGSMKFRVLVLVGVMVGVVGVVGVGGAVGQGL